MCILKDLTNTQTSIKVLHMNPIIVVLPTNKKGNPSDEKLYDYQNGNCFYCDGYMLPIKQNHRTKENCLGPQGYTYDHLMPASLGFTLVGNKVLACRGCNNDKANRLPTAAEIVKASMMYLAFGKKCLVTVASP